MTRIPRGTAFLVGLLAVGTLAALAVPEPRAGEGMIASTDPSEVCAEDGLPGSAYSRSHRVVARRAVPGKILDHVVPICAGGADTDANIQLQSYEDAELKDQLERFVCKAVCRYHTLTLAEGQAIFLGNWRDALWRIGP